MKVAGRAPSTVKAVIVRVYGGWALEGERAVARQDAGRHPGDSPDRCTRGARLTCAAQSAGGHGRPASGQRRQVRGDAAAPTERRRLRRRRGRGGSGQRSVSALAGACSSTWGDCRGYFSLGGAVSQNRSAFSQVDTFVGFTTDARLCGWADREARGRSSRPDGARAVSPRPVPRGRAGRRELSMRRRRARRAPAHAAKLTLKKSRFQMNAFGEARVGFRLATTGTGDHQPPRTWRRAAGPREAAFQRPDQLAFNSDQPGLLPGRPALPGLVRRHGLVWKTDGKVYSFYGGPILRSSARSSLRQPPSCVSRVVDIDLAKAATDTSRFTVKREDTRRGAQPVQRRGRALRHLRVHDLLGQELRHRQVANDPVDYLDLTWGSASGLRVRTGFTRTVERRQDRSRPSRSTARSRSGWPWRGG